MPTGNEHASGQAVRCFTRAFKNARYLQENAPELFAKDPSLEGFGTGIPLEILRVLHRIPADSPLLNRHKPLSDFLDKNRPPVPGVPSRDGLFSGTIYFAQITFQTPGGDFVISTSDMNQIVRYAQHAIVPISGYAAHYGPNTVTVSPTLLTLTVKVSGSSYTDADLQGWVNQMATSNHLSTNSCIFVVSPAGVSAKDVGGNAGYHGKANIPYVVAGVFAASLTLADNPDVYAMVVSHEIAEMIVDPAANNANPEVCDPCDLNCSNLTRCYFDASDIYLGSNQSSPPGGFAFAYYTCAVVKPAAATACPASSTNCEYGPFPYQTRVLEVATTFVNETDGTWLMADWDHDGVPDLVFIKTNNTPNGHVEVHIASGKSNYQTRVLEVATTFVNETDGTWLMADWDHDGVPDLVFIKTNNTPNGHVEVHIASGKSNYQTRVLEVATTFVNETDGTWLMADWDHDGVPDLVFIKTNNTPNGHVEVHIASGKSNYQTRVLEVATTFVNETDGTWLMADWDHDGVPDLVFIKTNNTPNGHVEVHIASGKSNYQTRVLEVATTFVNETDGTWLMADWDHDGVPDLVFIKTNNTPNGHVEVHIASG